MLGTADIRRDSGGDMANSVVAAARANVRDAAGTNNGAVIGPAVLALVGLAAVGVPGLHGDQRWVIAAGAVLLGALAVLRQYLALRWQVAAIAAVVVSLSWLLAVSGDGWPGRTPAALLACAAIAFICCGAIATRWWTWSGFWFLAAVVTGVAFLLLPGELALHRIGLVGLAMALLVAVAKSFSTTTLRIVAVLTILAAAGGLAHVGDRAATERARAVRSETEGALEAIAAESGSLRDELPCGDARRERPPDARLCASLDDLGDRASALSSDSDRDPAAGADAVRDMVGTLAQLRNEVAVRLLPSDTEGEARLDLAVRREGATPAPPAEAEDPDLRTLIADGLDAVVADVVEPAVEDRTAARLGDWGWVVVLVVAALGYRGLEILNKRRYGAPLAVHDVDAPQAGDADKEAGRLVKAVMRDRIAEFDLREPAPVPGAEADAKPTSDIVGALDADVPGGRTVATLFRVARGTLFPLAGVTIEPTYRRVGDEHVVTVRIVTARGRRPRRARSFARSTPEEAARAAADFVVQDSLTHSLLNPSWTEWENDDGGGLAPYREVMADAAATTGPRLGLGRQIALLDRARAASPGTGLVLVELGHRYDLDEKPIDALWVHLSTRTLHPRFTQARYRAAVSLLMLAGNRDRWAGADPARRHQIAGLIAERGLWAEVRRSRWWAVVWPAGEEPAPSGLAWLEDPDTDPTQVVLVFLLIARLELKALERRLSYPGLLVSAARQSERHVWLAILGTPRRRRAMLFQYRTARWATELQLALLCGQPAGRKPEVLRRKVANASNRRWIGTGALYNIACFHALLSTRDGCDDQEAARCREDAIRHLTRVVQGGQGPAPSEAWFRIDPALAPLRGTDGFERLLQQIRADEQLRREDGGAPRNGGNGRARPLAKDLTVR
jgi:hypothetical protein